MSCQEDYDSCQINLELIRYDNRVLLSELTNVRAEVDAGMSRLQALETEVVKVSSARDAAWSAARETWEPLLKSSESQVPFKNNLKKSLQFFSPPRIGFEGVEYFFDLDRLLRNDRNESRQFTSPCVQVAKLSHELAEKAIADTHKDVLLQELEMLRSLMQETDWHMSQPTRSSVRDFMGEGFLQNFDLLETLKEVGNASANETESDSSRVSATLGFVSTQSTNREPVGQSRDNSAASWIMHEAFAEVLIIIDFYISTRVYMIN